MDPLQIRNPFTDQNQTQHNSLRSGELLKGQNSSSADQRGLAHEGSTYKVSVSFFFIFFYFVRFLAQRPAKTAGPILTIYTSNDAVSRKEVPFGGRNACKNFQGVHFPQKHPKIGPPMGISSLNKSMNNFWTVRAISAHISSIGAAWRKKFKTLNEITQNSF